MPDKMQVTILEDGTIRIETDKISGPNHLNAENLLREVAKLAGGPVTLRKKQSHGHDHHHEHEHEHQ